MLRITPTAARCPLPAARTMIRCHLARLMQRDKLKIAEVARLAGINRSTVTALYRERAVRLDLPAVERLCGLFHCPIGELFEIVADEGGAG